MAALLILANRTQKARNAARQEKESHNSTPLRNTADMTVPTRNARINTTTARAAYSILLAAFLLLLTAEAVQSEKQSPLAEPLRLISIPYP
jgi:hypothetical protein